MSVRAYFVNGPAEGTWRTLEGDPKTYTFTVMEGGGGDATDWTPSQATQEVEYRRGNLISDFPASGLRCYGFHLADVRRWATDSGDSDA